MARVMCRRLLLALVCLVAVAAAPAQAATKANWNKRDQRAVVRAGLMAPLSDGSFHGERDLTAAQLSRALTKLTDEPAAVPGTRITVTLFHRLLIRQLRAGSLARRVQDEARRAGLDPPARFGIEVVARQLGLRFNHPDDRLELYPNDTITRAEAAYSIARVMHGANTAYAYATFSAFDLPRYTAAQKRVLRIAVDKIGVPYVWGGESDTTGGRYGPQAHGGYDCSGFAWRVLKLSGDPAGNGISGRTAAQMAGEIPKRSRVRFDEIRPADLLFFGRASFRSKATESGITHMGIALSGTFMIHSSSQGVYVSPLLEGWRRDSFAWARRIL